MAGSAFGLLLVTIYVRHLKASEFGILSLLMVLFSLLTIVFKMGLNHAFFRYYCESEDPEHRRRVVGSVLVFLLVSSALLTALLWAAAPQISTLMFSTSESRADLVRLIFLASFFDVMTVIPDCILRGNLKSARYSVLNAVTLAVQFLLVAYLVIAAGLGVRGVLIGRLAGAAFGAAIFYFVVRRELSFSFSGPELRGMLAFGVPLIFGQLAFTLFLMIDRFFIERYVGKAEVGIYSMSNSIISVISVLVTVPFGQVWTVMQFSVMNEEVAEEYYSRALTYIVFTSMLLALCVSAVAGDGLLLYGLKGYWPAATIIPLLSLSAVLDSASRVLNIGISLKKQTLYAPVVIVAALAVNICLNFLLIPRYQVLGATAATLVSFMVFCALRYWVSSLFFKVRYEWGRVLIAATVGAVLIVFFYLIDYLRGDTPRAAYLYLSILLKAMLALSFPLLLLALRFYDERERRRLAELWQKVSFMLKRRRWNEA